MKILMIGGTEFFGKILVAKLLDAGHELTLLTRGNKRPISFWSRINHIKCDRTNYKDFKSKLDGHTFDVVIDNAIYRQSDVKSIIDIFAFLAKPPQYILCSSVAVYSNWGESNEEIKEDLATLEQEDEGDDRKISYANGKRAAEKYLIAHHLEMPYTIIRPTVIEGPEDPSKRTWFWIQRIQDGFPILVSTKFTHTLYRHVSPTDVAQAFFLAAGNVKSYNKIYNVAGEKVLTIKEYVKHIAKVLGKSEVVLCWVSDADIRRELKGYMLPPFFERVRLISSIDRIKEDLGYNPQTNSSFFQETVMAYSDEETQSIGYDHRKDEIRVADIFQKNCEVLELESEGSLQTQHE